MTEETKRPEFDLLNAIFAPVIRFFVGLAIGLAIELAGVTSWWFSGAVLFVCAMIGWLIVAADQLFWRFNDWFFAKIGWGSGGIKQPPPHLRRPKHWFNRIGWVIGLALGLLAHFVLPKEVIAWVL